ncbi:MAG TPA: GntR family transcriptional regulator [Thermotogota bacterium]|nr:GntR family transcriptional regulator [Thermotogota bacterium]HRW34525.1 GntR family transcriptional regulator [Thermotogota bacterium]
MKKLDRSLPVPLYYQLYKELKKKILNSELKPGDGLSSEFEFCKQYKISRLTVRKALEELSREGLITRSRGRGTFVSQSKQEENLTQLQGFTDEVESQGQHTSSIVLENRLVEPPPEVVQCFAIADDTPVIFLKRLRLVDNSPMAIESAYFNTTLNPRLLKLIQMDMENNSVYHFFKHDLGIVLEYADEIIEVHKPVEGDREMLKIKSDDCAVLRRRYTYISENRCIEYVISLYRGDKYKFKVRLGTGCVTK